MNEIKYDTTGVVIRGNHVTGLGLYGAISPQEQKAIEREEELALYKELGIHPNGTPMGLERFYIPKSLQEQGLRKIQLTTLPESFGSFKHLQTLSLALNKIITLPESFGQLESLQNLTIPFNNLKTLPESFGQLKALKTLHLGYNQLKELPETFVKLKSLQNLNLLHNQIRILPESFGQLTSLQTTNFVENQLMTLPDSFGQLRALQVLNLSKNQLEELPESFGLLKVLQDLNLTHNQLKNLPLSMWRLKNLKTVWLDGNPWEGEWKEMTTRSIAPILEFCRRLDCIHIFISYAVADYERAVYPIAELANNLTTREEIYYTYHCMQDMKKDGQIDIFMNETIPECQLVLFIATKNSLQSKDCQHELALAHAHDIKVIPILGDDIEWDELGSIKPELKREFRWRFRDYELRELCNEIYNYIVQFKREKAELKELKVKIKRAINNFMESAEFKANIDENLLQFKEIFKKLSENQISPLEYYLKTVELLSQNLKTNLS